MNKVASAFAIGLSTTIGATALAATPGTHEWSGLYGGVVGGSGRQQAKWNWVASIANGSAAAQPGSVSLSNSHSTFSGVLGYNVQVANLVYGGEVDYGTFEPSSSFQLDGAEGYTAVKSASQSLGSARARFGYAAGNVLVFGTAGVALGDIKNTYTAVNSFYAPNIINAANSKRSSGWVAGAGLEFACSPRVSLRIEGLYYDFGSANGSVTSSRPATDTFRIRNDVLVERIGATIRF